MTSEKIAVVGMSCRFPDAPDVDAFRSNLVSGACAIRAMSDEEIIAQGGSADVMHQDDFVNAGTVVEGTDLFDADLFGISPREAESMDPQHRLFLQECRVLMDRANLTGGSQRIGVYAACRQSTYQNLLDPIRPEEITKPQTFQQLLGNDKDYLATRVAYRLNLTGPAITVQTACSSSLVAIHLACEALRQGEADAMIAGGVGISFPQGMGYVSQPGMIFSVTGLCRPFSANGDGIVAGNGLGVVALKRLRDAQRDGDKIHAVVSGSAMSNDGAEKVGYTAPGAKGQMTTIQRALEASGIDPKEVGLVEAHATGTPLGDPVEVSALDAIYRGAGVARGACAIGSVKGNVGHLDTAAGVASLIKAVLAVRTGRMPKTLHAMPENPHVNFERSAFYPLHDTQDWPGTFDRRIAAVSSFGIGGTNCHILVEQAPARASTNETDHLEILAFSGRSHEAVEDQASALRVALTDSVLPGVCRTAALHRTHFPYRGAVVGHGISDVLERLAHSERRVVQDTGSIAFMFSGQGSQRARMGEALRANDAFRHAFDTCLDGFAKHGFADLHDVIQTPDRAHDLDRTLYAQPALFAFQRAYAVMLESWGILPDLVFGHSVGEFAAAVSAGAMSEADAVTLVAERARLMEHETAPGAMLALTLSETDAGTRIASHPEVSVAAINGAQRVTVSGPLSAIDRLEQELSAEDVWTQRLKVNRAFHSVTMEPIMERFHTLAQSLGEAPAPQVPMVSTLSGRLVEPQRLDAEYWAEQLRAPVRFAQAAALLSDREITQVIEIGPDGSFSRLLKSDPSLPTGIGVVSSGFDTLEALIAELYVCGHDAPLTELYQGRPAPLEELPALALEPKRYWPAPKPQKTRRSHALSVFSHFICNHAVDVSCDGPMPMCDGASLVHRRDGFLGDATAQFLTQDGVRTVRISRSVSSPLLPDAPRLPLGDICRAEDMFQSAWLAPNWSEARFARRDGDVLWLDHFGVCVGRITLRAPMEMRDIAQWSWTWEALSSDVPRSGLRISVLGRGDLAEAVAAETANAGHYVSRDNAEQPADVVLDCRLADLAQGLDAPERLLHAAYEVAQSWISMGALHSRLRGVVLVPDAPGDVPVSGGWAVQSLWRSLRNELATLNTGVAFVGPDALPELIRFVASDTALPVSMRVRSQSIEQPVLRERTARHDELALDWPGTTLIAGFGAVGMALAQWLAGQGANSIALVMHRSLDEVQKNCVRALEEQGAQVSILMADVTDTEALHAAISALNTPVQQVFHTAHAGQGGLLQDNDLAAFSASLGVKTAGSQALWEAVKDQPLNVFCLFSSAASALALPVPAPGVGYCVANAWQDAFAAGLRAQGAPAVSIAWGQWEMTRQGEKGSSEHAFVQPIAVEDGFGILNHLLKSGLSAQVPIRYNAARLSSVIQGLPGTRPVLQNVLSLAEMPGDTGSTAESVEDMLRALIANRLRIAPEDLIPGKPLTEQGVDSLIFLEIVQIINRRFGLSLPPTAGYDFGSLSRLAAHVDNQLSHGDVDFSHMLDGGGTTIVANPADAHEPFPLTDLQQAFWLGRGKGMNMGGVACHEYVELEFDTLDVTRLEDAWNHLIARHDMMRCIITSAGQQVIQPGVPRYTILENDLTGMCEAERDAALDKTRERMTYQVFDPEKWPLFELCVSHLPGGRARLHLDMDLLVFDIQSFRVIYSELAILLDDPDADLPRLGLTFRDYIMAEKALEATETWRAARDHWQGRLDDFYPAPDLPLTRDPDRLGQPKFRCLAHRLPPEIWRRFQDHAAARGLTPSAVMLTAYTHAIAAFAKAPDFTLNVTYFNRKNVHPQVMDICGDFTSLMLLPVSARTDIDFLTACKLTQHELWQALEHRDYNGLRVMRDLGRKAGGGAEAVHMPVVFTSMIGMDFDDPDQPGYELRKRQVYEVNQTPQVWLDYQATEYGGALMTRWFVADELFDPAMIAAMFERYTAMLEWLAEHPEAWDDNLPDLRSACEIAAMEALHSVDETVLPTNMRDFRAPPDTIQADKPAVLTAERDVSHAELECRVNQLAHHLVRLGLGPAQPVAVALPKSVDAVVAALAIQMAGGCYVPINAGFPAERLTTILRDLEPFAVFADVAIEGMEDVLWLRPDDLALSDLPTTRPDLAGPSQSSYIIYTSGTTGAPKGVVLDHAAPINTLHQLGRILETTSRDRALSMCAFHHDMSVFDIFAMMACGGAIVLPEGERATDPDHWVELMQSHAPSILNAVPAFVSLLLDALDRQGADVVAPRHIMMGGDWIPVDLVHRIRARWPKCRVHSIGGPTETAVVSMHHEIGALEPETSRIPYGRPLSNQRCYLLNEAGQDCPQGVSGEICMGGLARSVGYHNDPERTAERYKPHPITGEILFHTGDIGLLRPDGQIDILGRVDNQIKINGQRVEASEVERAIEAQPQINQAVVLYGGSPVKQLQGFVCAQPEFEDAGDDGAWERIVDAGIAQIGDLPENIDLAAYSAQYHELERYATLVMLRTLQAAGFFKTTGARANRHTLMNGIQVAEGSVKLFESWLRALEADGFVAEDGAELVATARVAEAAELPALTAQINARTATGEGHEQRIWSLISRCGDRAAELLRAEFNPLELMFEAGKTDFVESWYRENPVSQHFNHVAGQIASRFLDDRAGPLRILEFGAGIGSATHDVLRHLNRDDFIYDFTDLSDYFLEQAAQTFSDWPQMRFGLFDINDDPGLQGYALGSYDLIIGANVLHDAADANAASRKLRALLKPDGAMMLIEGTTNPRFQMISLGFVEGLTHYADERLETCLPMLSAPRWQALMQRAGFARSAAFPPPDHPVEAMNYHVMLSRNDGTRHDLDVAAISQALSQTLPAHMIPVRWHQLESFPLTRNGKVDRSRLIPRTETMVEPQQETPLDGPTQQELAGLWSSVLSEAVSSADANFFVCGGDSLLMTRLSGLIQESFGLHLDLATLLRHPVLLEQAALIDTARNAQTLAMPASEADEEMETGVI